MEIMKIVIYFTQLHVVKKILKQFIITLIYITLKVERFHCKTMFIWIYIYK